MEFFFVSSLLTFSFDARCTQPLYFGSLIFFKKLFKAIFSLFLVENLKKGKKGVENMEDVKQMILN